MVSTCTFLHDFPKPLDAIDDHDIQGLYSFVSVASELVITSDNGRLTTARCYANIGAL